MEDGFHERAAQGWALGLRLWWAFVHERTRGLMWVAAHSTCEQSARVSEPRQAKESITLNRM